MFPIKDLNFLSCTAFFQQVLQRTRSVQHTNNHFFGFIFGDGSDAIVWIFQLSKVGFGFSFRFVQTWIDWIFPFSDLKVWQSWIFATCQRTKAPIWFQTSYLSFFLHTDFSPHRFGTKALWTSIKLHKLFKFCIGSWNFSTWQFFLHECNSWYSWQIWALYIFFGFLQPAKERWRRYDCWLQTWRRYDWCLGANVIGSLRVNSPISRVSTILFLLYVTSLQMWSELLSVNSPIMQILTFYISTFCFAYPLVFNTCLV